MLIKYNYITQITIKSFSNLEQKSKVMDNYPEVLPVLIHNIAPGIKR